MTLLISQAGAGAGNSVALRNATAVRIIGARARFSHGGTILSTADGIAANVLEGVDTHWFNAATAMIRGGGAPRSDITGTEGDDIIDGTSGNDLIRGLGGDDWLTGNDGDDRLEGGDDDDFLDAGAGSDLLYGGAGHDNLGDQSGTPGDEQFYGEDGNDSLFIEWFSGTVAHTVLLDGGAGNDFLDFYTPNHALDQVTLIGGGGNDIIGVEGGLNVTVDAGADADRVLVVSAPTNVTVTLGTGADRLNISLLGTGIVTVTDFAAGDTGDQLELLGLFDGALIDWDKATNPFATGHIRLVQSGADTLVQIDRDAGGSAHGFVNLVTLSNVAAGALTAFNLGFFPPDGSVPGGQTITGTQFNNVLTGNFGNDIINGLAGDDRIRGRAGNDQIDGGDDNDTLDGDEGDDVIHGGAGFDALVGDAGDDLLYGDADEDTLDDRVSGDDQLFGGAGFDFLSVDRGNTGPGDTILMDAGADGASMQFTSQRYVDIVTFQGSGVQDGISVYGGGTVSVDAGAGDDQIGVNNLGGAVSLTLGAGTDSLTLGSIVNGGLITVDDFAGGPEGDRIYVQGIFYPYQLIQRGADTVIQVQNGDTGSAYVDYVLIRNSLAADFVLSSEDYLWTPGDQIDDPPIAVDDTIPALEGELVTGGALLVNDSDPDGPALSIAMVNGSAANVGQFITLASGSQLRVTADGGWDYRAIGSAYAATPDFFSGASNLYSYDSFTYTLAGGGTATVTVQIRGVDSADVLRGTAGDDVLAGGFFDDVYYVENAGDAVVENANQGIDTVYASVSYALGETSAVEILATTDSSSTAAINLSGNGLANTLHGNAGANTLSGGGGADIMSGGGGSDTYFVDNAGDVVAEGTGAGFDALYTSVSYVLGSGAEVEWLSTSFTAGTAAINLTGNELFNYVIGNAGANILNGGGGADVLIGQSGDDTYLVDHAGDQVVEGAGAGFDAVYASVSYALAAGSEVEWLSTSFTAGTAAINLTGNALFNYVIGNAGANALNGAGGADVMSGLGGGDTYHVDNAGDQVVEGAAGGFDAVYASVGYTLAAGTEVEWLSTAFTGGTAAINLTGNEIANFLIGNAGANTLNGAGGADVMIGYGGNDTYFVDNAGDQVAEGAAAGFDALYTDVSYALAAGAEIEWLATSFEAGTGAISLTGNEIANYVIGNAGGNALNGGGGADVLIGGGGADSFAFTTALGAGNVDTVADMAAGTDKVALDDAIFTAIGGLGALNANAFAIGAGAADASDRIIYNSATGQLFYDADGNGGGAQVQFATLSTGLALTASDFTVI